MKRRRSSLVFLLLILFFLPGRATGEVLGFAPGWSQGTKWQVRTVYRQLNGNWTAPVTWNFEVEETAESFVLKISGSAHALAHLYFSKNPFRVKKVVLTNIVKGKEHTRIRDITVDEPVYPIFSIVPFYCPLFFNLSETGESSSSGIPKIIQEVEETSCNNIYSILPGIAKNEWGVSTLPNTCYEVTVRRGNKTIFKQFWSTGFPWALYTESETCKAWLVK